MKISKLTLGILTSMVLLSVLFASVANLLSTDAFNIPYTNKQHVFEINDAHEKLIWFLQVLFLIECILKQSYHVSVFIGF